jgi:CheY-like chemotaxis protein
VQAPPPRVLLVEPDPALRELNKTILEEARYTVETPPEGGDAFTFAEHAHPQVIVLGIHGKSSQVWHVLDQLQANPDTRDIPIVVVSTSNELAAQAKASPQAQQAVVGPYNIQDLESALARALHNPPTAAVLPPATQPPPAAVAFASEELAKRARSVVLQTIRELHGIEPYKSRFRELTPSLVDNLGVMLGGIIEGLQRSLPPDQVLAAPTMQYEIREHVNLRRSQGIDAASTIQEYQTLAVHIGRFLWSQVGQDQVTAPEAFRLYEQVNRHVAELVREMVRCFGAQERPSNSPE